MSLIDLKKKSQYEHDYRQRDYVKEKARIRSSIQYYRNKLFIVNHYTKGSFKCGCPKCEEVIYDFLTVDHINNDGNLDRKKFSGPSEFYKWIIKNNYPSYLNVVCYNCNLGKRRFGICPHERNNKIM